MQNFKNHSRYNPLHHFILIPLTVAIPVWALIEYENERLALYPALLLAFTGVTLLLTSLLSRYYALKNQDRIIRLEMRQRYFELAGKSFIPLEKQLTLKQIIALRFAGNEELLALLDQTLSKKLAPKEIKMAIKDWQPDNNRV